MVNPRYSRILLAILVLLAGSYFAVSIWNGPAWSAHFPYDFAIDWTAARGWQQGLSLYDRPALHSLVQKLVGDPTTSLLFVVPFNSYINPPTTALLCLPFTLFAFPIALTLYRVTLLVGFAAAVWITGLALPPTDRRRGWLWGALALLLLYPVLLSTHLGQVDAWVMLGLAGALWASSRGRWALAGAAIALAGLIKLSPFLLLIYLLLARQWRAAGGAALTALAALSLTGLLGHLRDWWVWGFQIVPLLSTGGLSVYNQTLPAWVARILLPETNLIDVELGLGPYRLLVPALALLFLAVVWRAGVGPTIRPLALALLILAALLSSPIAWVHYASWACLAVVLMADHRLWAGRLRRHRIELWGCLIVGGLLQNMPIPAFPPAAITANWWLRLATGNITIGLLLWFGVGITLLMRRGVLTQPAQSSNNALNAARGVTAARDS